MRDPGSTVSGVRTKRAAIGAALVVLSMILSACSAYGGEEIGAGANGGRIITQGEHCAIEIPDGWRWYPAKWTAESPRGSQLQFDENLYGRPQYPDWEEAKQAAIDDVTRRLDNVEVTETDDSVRFDYGPNGGLTVLQRFDRIGCRLTFIDSGGAREEELPIWESIIDTLERTSPTPGFTPTT